MVRNIMSQREFDDAIKSSGLVVVDFYGDWCGPCRMIAPIVEQYSRKYPEVTFVKVRDEDCQDVVMANGIRAFPTFHFYVGGKKVDEMKGADANQLEKKVLQWKTAGGGSSFSGTGVALGWDGVGYPPGHGGNNNPQAAREARLKALEGKFPGSTTATAPVKNNATATTSTSKVSQAILAAADDDEDEALQKALALSVSSEAVASVTNPSAPSTRTTDQDAKDTAEAEAQFADEQSANNGAGDWNGEDMVPVPVNNDLLAQLTEMGFSDTRARKGLVHGKDNLENALLWLGEHEADADIDQPYMVRRADAEKELRKKEPLTEEQKQERIAYLKKKIEDKRKEREQAEKVEAINREKTRREQGQKIETMQEERDRMMRKREAERVKKEKEDEKRERERLRAEIARDKELRRINKGVLPSVLGVDGYNPAAGTTSEAKGVVPVGSNPSDSVNSVRPPENALPASSVATATASSVASKPAAAAVATSDKEAALKAVETALTTMSRYRTGGDGGQAIKMVQLFVNNVVQNPSDAKYQTINLESKAFKAKCAPLVGPLQLLKAVGFVKNEEEQKLLLERLDIELLREALDRINIADKLYMERNPV